MNSITEFTGMKIRNYRKMKNMTINELADTIHKSRATVSKYENGQISLDLETLYDISQALDVGIDQLTDYHPKQEEKHEPGFYTGTSPFFKADRLYFYFYDGRYNRLKEGIIDIHKDKINEDGSFEAAMSICSSAENGRSSEVYYSGNVLYSDMLIRMSFVNKYNKLEQDLLYIFNPLELRSVTEGLLCGISTADLMPCAFKCLVALSANEDYDELKNNLMLTSKEIRRWQKLNMLIVDNNG